MYLSLLRMYLSTPDAHCLGPIKLQLPEPQANLKEALQVLKLHHSKLNTTKVNLCSGSSRRFWWPGWSGVSDGGCSVKLATDS